MAIPIIENDFFIEKISAILPRIGSEMIAIAAIEKFETESTVALLCEDIRLCIYPLCNNL